MGIDAKLPYSNNYGLKHDYLFFTVDLCYNSTIGFKVIIAYESKLIVEGLMTLQILEGRKMVRIPFKLVGGIMLISVTANEKEGFFAFDTGAMQTAVNEAYFPELQGERIDIAKFSEGVKKGSAAEGTLDSLRFADMERSDMPVLIMDLMYVENGLKAAMPDIKFLGTLGIDVIKDHTVLLDYKVSEIVLDPECGFESQTVIPMKFEKLPIIQVEAAGHACDFVLDTGASICLLGQSFQNDPQLIPVSETPKIVTVPVVRVGGNEYKELKAAVSDITPIQKKVPVEGVIGYQILSPQRSILDFKNNQLIMERT